MSGEASGISWYVHFLGIRPQGREEGARTALRGPQSACPGAGQGWGLGSVHAGPCASQPTQASHFPVKEEGGDEKGRGVLWTKELGFLSECGNKRGREGMNGKCVNE